MRGESTIEYRIIDLSQSYRVQASDQEWVDLPRIQRFSFFSYCNKTVERGNLFLWIVLRSAQPRLRLSVAGNLDKLHQSRGNSSSGSEREREKMERESCPISFGDFFTAPNTINLLNRTLFTSLYFKEGHTQWLNQPSSITKYTT